MEWHFVIVLFFFSLLALLFLRVPVALALLAVDIVAAVLVFGWGPAMQQVSGGIYSSLTKYAYAPVPLFIFMGEVLFRSGIAQRAMNALDSSFGRVPARQPLLAQASGTVFGLLSGSTIANTAMLGRMLLPTMIEKGYSPRLAMGSIMGAGGLAMILPPSAMAVVWGATAQVPVGPLLIAGVIPGLLLATVNVLVIIGWSGIFKAAPSYSPEHRARFSRRWMLLIRDVLPLSVIILAVVGLIFFGIATPTESASIGAVAAAAVAWAYRVLTWQAMRDSVLGTVRLTTMIFFIVLASQIYSQIMSFTGASFGLVNWALGLSFSPILLMLVMLLLVVVLGMFLDQVSIMLITLPLFMPIVLAQGWDPVWFGIMMLICLETGMLSPPVGMSLFVMRGVAPAGIKMAEIYWAALPFVAVQIVVVGLLLAVPSLALWLPGLME